MTNFKRYLINERLSNVIWRSIQVFGKSAITLLIFFICAKVLSPYDFGIYNYLLSIIFLLIVICDFGISTAVSRYTTEYNLTDRIKYKSILTSSTIIVSILALFLSIFAILAGKYILTDKFYYIWYILPLVLLVPISSIYDGIYRGLKKFKQSSIIFIFSSITSLAFIYPLITRYGLIGALVAQDIFYLILVICLGYGYRDFDYKIDKYVIKEILSYSFLIGLANIGYFLYTRMDVVVLGKMGYIEELGYYEIINKIFLLLLAPLNLFSTVLAPDSTRDFISKNYTKIKERLFKESLFIFIIGLILSLFIFISSPYLFKNFLPEYNTNLLLNILNLIIFLLPFRYLSTYVSIGYITPMGFVKIITINLILFGLINVILDILLIGYFGFIGVVYATLISQIAYFICLGFFAYYKIKNLN